MRPIGRKPFGTSWSRLQSGRSCNDIQYDFLLVMDGGERLKKHCSVRFPYCVEFSTTETNPVRMCYVYMIERLAVAAEGHG